MKAVIYALPSACAGGIQTRLNDLLNWKGKNCFMCSSLL